MDTHDVGCWPIMGLFCKKSPTKETIFCIQLYVSERQEGQERLTYTHDVGGM